MYDTNPTLEFDTLKQDKTHDETRQGEAFFPLAESSEKGAHKFFYIESYGCQMNFSDSEIVASILMESGTRRRGLWSKPTFF